MWRDALGFAKDMQLVLDGPVSDVRWRSDLCKS